ncbi:MAG: phosphatidylserine decarboxylase family protein [Deltaproteobacteria bacterium]|jgi:phosphatidylserine decarboxylase|nr:phosphatidylserine decarboxylase family protein [Deltaproteobacteria bacterium]
MLDDYFKDKIPEFNINNSLFVARPGLPFILGLVLACLIAFFFDWNCLLVIFFLLLLFTVAFFRDPRRDPPPIGFGLSPADGQIIRVDRGATCPITLAKTIKVSVFMNVFNVHVNRVPCDARLEGQMYFAGKFFNASFDKSSTQNERNALILNDDQNRQIVMIQIAGLIARRIVSWVKPGQSLTRGQRFGLIRFGSRVDLYLPPEAEIMVGLGQKVYAGWSPIWRFPN